MIVLLHNLYAPGLRTASLSVDYVIVFNFPRDRSVISTLSRQIFPGAAQFLKDVYNYVTRNPHGYLFIDLTPHQNRLYLVRSNVFNDSDMFVFSPA